MPIREVRRYAELMKAGEATNEERLALLEAHRDAVRRRDSRRPPATSSWSSGRSTSTRKGWDEHEAAYAARPGGISPRARVHGHVRLLRPDRRGRGRQDDPTRPRAGNRLHRHGTALRSAHERDPGRPRDQGPPRRVRDRHEVQSPAGRRRPGRHEQRRATGRLGRARAQVGRGVARTARDGLRRPLLPAPRRSQRADRGDRGRDGRAGRAGQGPPHRPERGGARDDPSGECGSPDHRCADRVLALEPRPRSRGPADLPRARDRVRPLLPARARVSGRSVHLARRARRGRLPPSRPTVHG